ncbi:MAG: zinc ABC transporter substrate-binding protein, partial [Anaerolineae bacterium]|nr:zinc ABC transporter substrate-binding protein [Anaerolineae bacterium]
MKVVTSFSILADVVQQVAGDTIEVTSLIPAGVDPHSFSPSPRDIAAIAEADVVFINGANFEELLLEAITNTGSTVNLVVASNCVLILPSGATTQHDDEGEAEDEADHDSEEIVDPILNERCTVHEAELHKLMGKVEDRKVDSPGALYSVECGHHDHETETDAEHEQGDCDPHVWTDPENVIYWTLMIRDTLIE